MGDSSQPIALAAQQGAQVYETALVLDEQGANAKLNVPVWQLFARDPALTYEKVTLNVIPASPGADASNGTYLVRGASSEANIIWDADTGPTRSCLVRTAGF